jgi:hypothetical protein
MANMAYCRFRNTATDLKDCFNSEGMESPEIMSEEEQKARLRLILTCVHIAHDFGHEVGTDE